NNYTKLNIQEITFIESMGDFSRIHTTGQKKFVVLVSLKNIEKQLTQKYSNGYIGNLSLIFSKRIPSIIMRSFCLIRA
ncbi:MAG: LytTR family transcriptional regulator DNA-binding domain-containing protein, partial [Chitinophagaceae bacterium]|nr:LytTR family transcriptional regulator DNA-binding domain-containing protein [Chitinophagaceae bacterium]